MSTNIAETGRRAYDRLMERLTDALSTYRAGMGRVRREAGAYKDEQRYIEQHGAALASTARREVEAAEQEFSDTVLREVVPALRAEIVGHLTAQPDKELMQTLGYYHQFGIAMTKDEAKALSYDCAGNYLALRSLAAVAGKSGVNVGFTDVAEYIKTADRLQRLAQLPLMVCPQDYIHEALEVYPDVPLRRSDGTAYGSARRPDSISLLMSNTAAADAIKELDEVVDKLDATTVPEIREYEPIKTDDGTEISPAQQRAEDKDTAARQVTAEDTTAQEDLIAEARERAEADRKAAEDLKRYYL